MSVLTIIRSDSADYPRLTVILTPVISLPKVQWRRVLSPNEWQRVAGTQYTQLSNAIASRALMRRLLLGCELDTAPEKVGVVTDRIGRHTSRCRRYSLLSSSNFDFVATLCTKTSDVGLVIESEHTLSNYLEAGHRYLWSAPEKDSRDFFTQWCRRAAQMKSEGLSPASDLHRHTFTEATDSVSTFYCYRLRLHRPMWCAVYSPSPVTVSVTLLGTSIIQDFLRRRLNDPQVINEVLRKFTYMGLNPASLRLV